VENAQSTVTIKHSFAQGRVRARDGERQRDRELIGYTIYIFYTYMRRVRRVVQPPPPPISVYYANSVVNMEIIGNNILLCSEYVPLKIATSKVK